ncbi:MAG: hypothetical protein KDH98_10860 [Calditrichaeota bacterium]|nr:hypothetical protein [Calditrichota bacterium]
MKEKILVISGTRCSGKSTFVDRFCKAYTHYKLVKALTTREKRADDDDNYDYVTIELFLELKSEKKLFTMVEYQDNYYGITKSELYRVIEDNFIPVLVVAPSCLEQIFNSELIHPIIISIYFDEADETLRERYKSRGMSIDTSFENQLKVDRTFKKEYTFQLDNNFHPDYTLPLVDKLVAFSDQGGLLHRELIELMILNQLLVENGNFENISGASYDLTLGKEYFHNGESKEFSPTKPFLVLQPGDFAIVESNEVINLPLNIAGKFDIKVSLFCKGIILSNGPQVDPGFKGKLFCLLFNTSNDEIHLKCGIPYTTIEFNQLLSYTTPYSGKYQDKINLIHYLPKEIKKAAIVENRNRIDNISKSSFWEKTLPIAISLITFSVLIINYFMSINLSENDIRNIVKDELSRDLKENKTSAPIKTDTLHIESPKLEKYYNPPK